jgi:hypothetical protein
VDDNAWPLEGHCGQSQQHGYRLLVVNQHVLHHSISKARAFKPDVLKPGNSADEILCDLSFVFEINVEVLQTGRTSLLYYYKKFVLIKE